MTDRALTSSSRRKSQRSAHAARRTALTILALALLGLTVQTGAQMQPPTVGASDGSPNFDIRVVREGSSDYMERVGAAPLAGEFARARIASVARLQSDGKSIDVITDGPLGSIEVVSARPGTGFLTPPASDRVAAMREFMATYAEVYGLSQDQLDSLALVANYTNPAGNMAWVEFEQRVNGLPVFQGLIRGGFTASGELARTTGPLAPGLVAAALPTTATLSAAAAVARAAENVGWQVSESSLTQKSVEAGGSRVTFDRGTMSDDATAWLIYFPLAPGLARLAWATQILGDPYGYLTVLDAEDGTLLFRKNLTNFQTQPATYVVYNADSPAPVSPSTSTPAVPTQAPYIARSTISLIGNEGPNAFNDLGWMTDGTNGVNGHTDGNNVEAGMDLAVPDGVDAPIPGTNRVFDFAYDPEIDEPATAAYRNGEGTQLFYWTNVFHDRLYLLGFTEAARNFQHNNFGRGGLGNDRLRAEGQDFSGTNNANFLTPSDGSRGRMQMYRFPGPTPDRSSGLDQEVMLHELTHGLSNRLHNNASGLLNNMAGGLGEGWSDFYARALLSTADEDVNGVYATGGWVTHSLIPGYTNNYYYGIRRFPRAVRTTVGPNGKPHDPLTLADIDQAQMDLTDGAFPRGPIGSPSADQVHNMGEVWAGTLLEVRARFITRLGFAIGNERILQFVTDGMKLDPANPTLIQARDAILAAANAGGGTPEDIADIWAGFAARGMGVLAKITDPGGLFLGTTRVFESFTIPGDPLPTFSINDVSVAEGQAGLTTATFTVTLANPPATQTRVQIDTTDGTASSSRSFSNPASITIPSMGPAMPYPSAIVVPGGLGTVQAIAVRLHSVSHQWPADVDILLVGPSGENVVLMSDAGGFFPGMTGVDLTFRQGAPPLFATLPPASGVYSPTNVEGSDPLPSPAPPGPYGASLAEFNGTDPAGTWNLFVFDDVEGLVGQIAAGWTLEITTSSHDYVPRSQQLIFPPGVTTRSASITINGDLISEPNETFFVNLFEPVGAVIGDGQGLGTILNDDVPPPTTVQPPTGLRVVSVVGNSVTLRWDSAPIGPPATDHRIEGGINPGEVLAGLNTGSAYPVFTFTAPNGAFYIRAHALRPGDKSVASNEIRLFVNVSQLPSAPTNLLGVVNGSALGLTWINTFAGGAPTNIVLDVAGAGSILLPGQTDRFEFPAVPAGTYTLSVRAINAAGASGPSSPVTLTIPGPCTGAPFPPANFLAYKIDTTAYVIWDPPASGPSPTAYVVNVTGSFVGDFPTTARFLSATVAPGIYTLRVTAVNACGTATTGVQTITVP